MLAIFAVGEVFTVLFLLAFVAFVPILIGLIVFIILRRNNRNRAVWQNLSAELNLTMPNPKQLQMKGVYNNREVLLSIGARRSGGEDSTTQYYTYSVCKFPASLRLQLGIRSHTGAISRAFNSSGIMTGNENFDRAFSLSGYDPILIQHLILADFPSTKTTNLLGDLMLSDQSMEIVNISDDAVYIEMDGQVGDPQVLRKMLDITTFLTQRIYAARQKLPPAEWEKKLVQTWQNVASKLGLQFNSQEMAISGHYENFASRIEFKTGNDKWKTEFGFVFPSSLFMGLKIFHENSIHKALSWLGVQDIESGIKEFDDAFIVKAENVAVAKHRLRPEFCNRLVGLRNNKGDILVTDEKISVSFDSMISDENDLRGLITEITSIVTLFSR